MKYDTQIPHQAVFLWFHRTITGPNDRFYTITLTLPRVPAYDGLWSQTSVCVWDVAAAHLSFEDALRHDPVNVGGEAFLITGNGPPWSMNDSRAALQASNFFLPQSGPISTFSLPAYLLFMPTQSISSTLVAS
jgi:hypothetical protein